MSWFNAMKCCYYNKGYPAEPQNQAEQEKIVEYIQLGTIGFRVMFHYGAFFVVFQRLLLLFSRSL